MEGLLVRWLGAEYPFKHNGNGDGAALGLVSGHEDWPPVLRGKHVEFCLNLSTISDNYLVLRFLRCCHDVSPFRSRLE
jgi:hypothetical protein